MKSDFLCFITGEDLHRVQTGPIVDWCFQYSDTASIWVITQNAWYRLVDPAERYLETHQPDAEKLAICGAAVQEMQEDPATEILQAMEHGFAAQPSAVKPDMKLRKFVEMQLRAWIQVRSFNCLNPISRQEIILLDLQSSSFGIVSASSSARNQICHLLHPCILRHTCYLLLLHTIQPCPHKSVFCRRISRTRKKIKPEMYLQSPQRKSQTLAVRLLRLVLEGASGGPGVKVTANPRHEAIDNAKTGTKCFELYSALIIELSADLCAA